MADEYTPTTNVVRDNYSHGNSRRIAEFDRWLAYHDRKVRSDLVKSILADLTKER